MKSFIIGVAIVQLIAIAIQAYVVNSQGVVHNPFVGTYQIVERK